MSTQLNYSMVIAIVIICYKALVNQFYRLDILHPCSFSRRLISIQNTRVSWSLSVGATCHSHRESYIYIYMHMILHSPHLNYLNNSSTSTFLIPNMYTHRGSYMYMTLHSPHLNYLDNHTTGSLLMPIMYTVRSEY